MFVKIAQIPGAVKEVALESGMTVKQALETGEFSTDLSGKSLQVNAAPATLETVLNDGDRVTIAAGAKGNS